MPGVRGLCAQDAILLPQLPGVCWGRQCRAANTHLQRRQRWRVQAPCIRAPHSLSGQRGTIGGIAPPGPPPFVSAPLHAPPRPARAQRLRPSTLLPQPLPRRPPPRPLPSTRSSAPSPPGQLSARSRRRAPLPLVVLAITAGEVGGAYAEAAQDAGAAIPAAAQRRGRACWGDLWVLAPAASWPFAGDSPREGHMSLPGEALKFTSLPMCVCSGKPYLLI